MARLTILEYPDPRLRTRAAPVARRAFVLQFPTAIQGGDRFYLSHLACFPADVFRRFL
jgi:hypothetical protein